jgi:hypothetical protein
LNVKGVSRTKPDNHRPLVFIQHATSSGIIALEIISLHSGGKAETGRVGVRRSPV